MALNPQPLFDAAITHLQSLGLFEQVNGHAADVSPGYGLVATVEFVDMVPVRSSGLAATSVRILLAVTIMTGVEQEPADAIDPEVLTAAGRVFEAYIGDFELGGLVRAVDVRGGYGEPLRARGGYGTVQGIKTRAVIIDLPLVVNDPFPEAP